MAILPPNNAVLEEEIDEKYEPNEEELLEYARWLGMSLPEDQDLLWIAREGLKAPLPDHWKPCRTEDDEIYYFNFESGDSVWEHPCDEYYRKLYIEMASKKSSKYQHSTPESATPVQISSTMEQKNGRIARHGRPSPGRVEPEQQLSEVFPMVRQSNWKPSDTISSPYKLNPPDHPQRLDSPLQSLVFMNGEQGTSAQSSASGSPITPRFGANNSENSANGPDVSGIQGILTNLIGDQNLRVQPLEKKILPEGIGTSMSIQRSQLLRERIAFTKDEIEALKYQARQELDARVKIWIQEEERREIEQQQDQMKERVKTKILEEEHSVKFQQEQQAMVEMVEKIGGTVEEENVEVKHLNVQNIINYIQAQDTQMQEKYREEMVERLSNMLKSEELKLMDEMKEGMIKCIKEAMESLEKILFEESSRTMLMDVKQRTESRRKEVESELERVLKHEIISQHQKILNDKQDGLLKIMQNEMLKAMRDSIQSQDWKEKMEKEVTKIAIEKFTDELEVEHIQLKTMLRENFVKLLTEKLIQESVKEIECVKQQQLTEMLQKVQNEEINLWKTMFKELCVGMHQSIPFVQNSCISTSMVEKANNTLDITMESYKEPRHDESLSVEAQQIRDKKDIVECSKNAKTLNLRRCTVSWKDLDPDASLHESINNEPKSIDLINPIEEVKHTWAIANLEGDRMHQVMQDWDQFSSNLPKDDLVIEGEQLQSDHPKFNFSERNSGVMRKQCFLKRQNKSRRYCFCIGCCPQRKKLKAKKNAMTSHINNNQSFDPYIYSKKNTSLEIMNFIHGKTPNACSQKEKIHKISDIDWDEGHNFCLSFQEKEVQKCHKSQVWQLGWKTTQCRKLNVVENLKDKPHDKDDNGDKDAKPRIFCMKTIGIGGTEEHANIYGSKYDLCRDCDKVIDGCEELFSCPIATAQCEPTELLSTDNSILELHNEWQQQPIVQNEKIQQRRATLIAEKLEVKARAKNLEIEEKENVEKANEMNYKYGNKENKDDNEEKKEDPGDSISESLHALDVLQ